MPLEKIKRTGNSVYVTSIKKFINHRGIDKVIQGNRSSMITKNIL